MNPPAGRIQIGDRVALPDGRQGLVAKERYTLSNGSWRYTVDLDGGGTVEALDYTLTKKRAI
jgi:hypothetical protein